MGAWSETNRGRGLGAPGGRLPEVWHTRFVRGTHFSKTARSGAPGTLPVSGLLNARETKGSAEQAGGEHDGGPEQGEDSMDGDADDAEGKQQQPHDGIEDQREQGHGPANYEKKTPKQERDHG